MVDTYHIISFGLLSAIFLILVGVLAVFLLLVYFDLKGGSDESLLSESDTVSDVGTHETEFVESPFSGLERLLVSALLESDEVNAVVGFNFTKLPHADAGVRIWLKSGECFDLNIVENEKERFKGEVA